MSEEAELHILREALKCVKELPKGAKLTELADCITEKVLNTLKNNK